MRNLCTRIDEHRYSPKSEVCKHLQENGDHRVDFANPIILGSAGDAVRLRILESLQIQLLQPTLNTDGTSVPLYLFNT